MERVLQLETFVFEEAEAVAKEIKALGCTALAVKMDLSNYDDVATGFAKIQEKAGDQSISWLIMQLL